jgi:hypothetical protein
MPAERASAVNVVPIRIEPDDDPLSGFRPEHGDDVRVPDWLKSRRSIVVVGAVAACLAAGLAVAYLGARLIGGPALGSSSQLIGRALLRSRPEGVSVTVDGVSRGVTPIELELAVGQHTVRFQNATVERTITQNVEPGTRVAETVELPSAPAVFGQVEVTSDPPGARVTVDGNSSGVTPMTLSNVSAGRHVVAVGQSGKVITRTVDVTPGATASVFVAVGQPAGGGTGWLSVDSSLELRIVERGQLLGVSTAAPLMLAAGEHQFELVNDAVGLRVSRTVSVDSGKTTRVSMVLPNGALSVNAVPWAEVFVDGRSIGVTPLGEVAVPVGSHEIAWRHPQLGEKRQTVVVLAEKPTRVSMDLNR